MMELSPNTERAKRIWYMYKHATAHTLSELYKNRQQ